MSIQIIPFRSSMTNCYIIRDKGVILFDGGWSGENSSIADLLLRYDMRPDEIKLIILSHGDFDHAGGASELKRLTGAKIAIHEKDRINLEKGIFHWPGGVTPWGKFSRALFKPMLIKKASFPAVKADMVLDDQDLSLEPYGIPGKIIHTPGHTYGSVSVVLDSGDAFIGCLAHNRFPFVLKPRLPIYAKDIGLLKQSWKKVIKLGARNIYPGHGKPFPVEKILTYLD